MYRYFIDPRNNENCFALNVETEEILLYTGSYYDRNFAVGVHFPTKEKLLSWTEYDSNFKIISRTESPSQRIMETEVTPIAPQKVHSYKLASFNKNVSVIVDKLNTLVHDSYNHHTRLASVDIRNWNLDGKILEAVIGRFASVGWQITQKHGDQRDPYSILIFEAKNVN